MTEYTSECEVLLFMLPKNYNCSVKHNTGLFLFKLCLYMCATCFSLNVSHHHACLSETCSTHVKAQFE